MLLNQVEVPISLGLSFRHCLNDAPANTSTLTWHLLSLLLSPTSSVRLLIFPLESWVVFKKKKIKICLYSWKWLFFFYEPSIFFHLWTLNCMLLWQHFYSWKYPATPSHFKKTPTVQSQTVVLLHALMLGMKVNQSSEKLFITWWHLQAYVSLKKFFHST